MHSRPSPAVPNTPESTNKRTGPDFKWNTEIRQPVPVTPEPITESTPEPIAEAMPAATTQAVPRQVTMPAATSQWHEQQRAQLIAEVVAAGIAAGIAATQPTTTEAQPPEYKKKRSYGGQVIYNNQRPAKQPSTTNNMTPNWNETNTDDNMTTTLTEATNTDTSWKEITEDKFRTGYRNTHQIEDIRRWAGDMQTWVTEAEMFRMFEDIGYCLVVNPGANTIQQTPSDLRPKYTTNHTTKYYYTPHVDACSAWPDGVEQHVEAFFNTHRDARRDNSLWGFLF